MQITREQSTSNLIRAFEPGRIRVGERWITGNLIVSAEAIVSDWRLQVPGRITVGDLAPALELKPELIIVGAGFAGTSPDMELIEALAAQAIGVEYMQTDSACRTFNVLIHEGRQVAAALLQEKLAT
jgi:uncharacterized protein